MTGGITGRLDALSNWSSTLFTLAGILFLVATGFFWLEDFVDFSASYLDIHDPAWLHGLVLTIAWIPALLGLLGLSVRLSKRAPRVAEASAWIATLASAAVVVQFAWSGAVGVSAAASMPPDPVFLLTLGLILLGFVSFGLAILWTDVHGRRTGILLVGYAPLSVGAIVTDNWVSTGLGVLIAAVLLGIGYIHAPDDGP